MDKTVVTAALIYANGPVHIGHLVEYTQADVYVRYLRLMGHDAIYCCADDTHGTPIELQAQSMGIAPEEMIEKFHKDHFEDFKKFDIEFDSFYTTNAPENKELSDLVFSKAKEKGHIYSKRVELTYCENCSRFLPDRFVRGTCPKCQEPEQYGDQCEACKTTYSPTDLLDARCAQCGNPPGRRESEHYFFKLSDFTDRIREWFDRTPTLQSEVRNYLENWMKEGLRDWDITRDAPYFGFKILGEEDKYYYVWLDAPIGYIASTKHYCEAHGKDYEDYWKKPGSKIIHIIGKDIIYFHFLFWPAMLMAADFNLPSDIVVHGFLTMQGLKMSKSRGSFITAKEYLERGGDPSYLRFYYASSLVRNLNDIDLVGEDFKNKINAGLIGNVANFVNRTLSFLKKNFDRTVQGSGNPELEASVAPKREHVLEFYGDLNFRDAVKTILEISDLGNRYIQSNEPWKKLKEDRVTAQEIVSAGIHIVRDLAALLKPIVPSFSKEVESQLGLPDLMFKDLGASLDGHQITDAAPILKKVEKLDIFYTDPFAMLDIRTARIEAVEDHPQADKLIILTIDAGEEKRRLVAGLQEHYTKEELEGKSILFLANLKPARLRGVQSNGMILAADQDDRVGVLEVEAEPGQRVTIQGQELLQPEEIDLDFFFKVKIVSKGDRVVYGDESLRVGKALVRADKGIRGRVK
ncbi:methionine--tRNA ligase [Acidobacteriota bacterium]